MLIFLYYDQNLSNHLLIDLDKQTKAKLTITSTEPKPQLLKSDSKLSTKPKPIPKPVDEEKKYQIKSGMLTLLDRFISYKKKCYNYKDIEDIY